ncbi:GNAT family N-acetyltransferase [Mycoplasmatota bacterium WC44]
MDINFIELKKITDYHIEMIKEFFNFHRRLTEAKGKYLMSFETAKETLNDWLKENIFRIIIVDEKEVGFIYYKTGGQDFAWLEDIFILEEYRGKGYGKKIVNKFFDVIKASGVVSCVVNVIPRNEAAIKFYISCGFDHLNMIELRVNFDKSFDKDDEIEVLGHKVYKY